MHAFKVLLCTYVGFHVWVRNALCSESELFTAYPLAENGTCVEGSGRQDGGRQGSGFRNQTATSRKFSGHIMENSSGSRKLAAFTKPAEELKNILWLPVHKRPNRAAKPQLCSKPHGKLCSGPWPPSRAKLASKALLRSMSP